VADDEIFVHPPDLPEYGTSKVPHPLAIVFNALMYHVNGDGQSLSGSGRCAGKRTRASVDLKCCRPFAAEADHDDDLRPSTVERRGRRGSRKR